MRRLLLPLALLVAISACSSSQSRINEIVNVKFGMTVAEVNKLYQFSEFKFDKEANETIAVLDKRVKILSKDFKVSLTFKNDKLAAVFFSSASNGDNTGSEETSFVDYYLHKFGNPVSDNHDDAMRLIKWNADDMNIMLAASDTTLAIGYSHKERQ